MNKSQDVFRTSDEAGIDSVIKADGRFAYFMESSSIEYYVARRCQLTQVGGLLDNKGYGIGVAKGECSLVTSRSAPSCLPQLCSPAAANRARCMAQ